MRKYFGASPKIVLSLRCCISKIDFLSDGTNVSVLCIIHIQYTHANTYTIKMHQVKYNKTQIIKHTSC